MGNSKRMYENDNIIVSWDGEKCMHSGECVKACPGVFNPDRRPWIDLSQDTDENTVEAIKGCPSGALQYKIKNEGEKELLKIVFEPESKRSAAYECEDFVGECTYSESPGLWIIDHTSVNPEYKGQGIGSKLVLELIEEARKNDLKIMPLCPFAAKEFREHPEYGDVLKK